MQMKYEGALPRTPPLQALRAFESAARLGSFAQAALELSLTYGAIGQQVRALEGMLGVPLFDRVGRGVMVTEAGARYARRTRALLLELAAATAEMARADAANRLTLSVLPSFAARWLVKRVGAFIDANPDLELIIETSTQLADLRCGDVDLCIRFGVGPWEGLACERILDDEYYPVCAPGYWPSALPPEPAALRQFPLLLCHDEPWSPWLQAAGLHDISEPRGTTYSDAVNLLQAARERQGIALARHSLVQDDLASGALVRLFQIGVRCPRSYFLVSTQTLAKAAKVRRFRAWLLTQLGSTIVQKALDSA